MKKIFALLLALVMVLSMAACGGSQQPAPTTAQPQAPANNATASADPSAPVEQTLRLITANGGNTGVQDRLISPWEDQNLGTMQMFRSLFLAETDLTTLKSDLADANFKVSDDGLVYEINFIGGSKWSDGEPITPQDVAFSIKANLKTAVSNGIYTNAFNKIKGAAAWKDGSADDLEGLVIDGNKITITLDAPYRALAATLAQFAILPEHVLKDADVLELTKNVEFWSHPVSSGAFMLTEFNVGNYYVLEQNPYYDGVKPKITKIVSTYVADQITAAQAGQVDYFNTNVVGTINEVQKINGMQMFPVDILFYRYFICNMKGVDGNENPAMQNPLVREAILHAIDRETLASSLFPGLATLVNSGVSNTSPAFNGKVFEYNPEKAKELLKEANYDFSHKFRILYYYSDQGSIDFMEAIAYYLREVGMDVEVIQTTQGTQDLFQTRNYDVGYKGLSAFDISEWYGEYNSANANFQNIFGGDTAFDGLISKLAAATDEVETNKILTELSNLENEMLYKLPLFTLGNNVFINTNHLKVNDNQVFGNPWYKTDIGFENWEIVG